MNPLFAVLPLMGPLITRVCPDTCPYATIQDAVDAVPDGGSQTIGVDAQILDGAVRIEGKDITLLPYLTPLEITALLVALDNQNVEDINEVLQTLDTVTLTNTGSAGEATITTVGGSLTLLGIGVDGGLSRAIEATDTQVSMAVTTLFGRGIVADGGLLRVERGSLDVFGGGIREGSAAGQGGLVAAYDADVSFTLTAFSNGSASRGACLFAESSGERHTVTLSQTSFRACEGSLQGGAVHLTGPVTAELIESTLSDSSSGRGGGIALIGPGVIATLDDTIIDSCVAFDVGGGIYVDDATLTMNRAVLSRDTAFYGGALAAMGAGAQVTSNEVQFSENSAVYDGGALFVGGGTYRSTDAVVFSNIAGDEGGGLYLNDEAVWQSDVRSTLCNNQAGDGGGIWAQLSTGVTLSNLRLLNNVADADGGGLYHAGAPLELSFANLLGNAAGRGSGAAALTKDDLELNETVIAYNLGSVAVVPRNLAGNDFLNGDVEVGPTLWFANEQGDMDGLSPTDPLAMFADPLLNRYVPGDDCLLAQDWPTWSSPMHRTEDPTTTPAQDPPALDLDGTVADMGAYGGPLALPEIWETDEDGDLVPQIYDCDDGNPQVNPEVTDDTPYDGIDADCALDDDFDGDRDGFRRDEDGGTDCNDEDPLVYPGAVESPASLVDANCDGLLDADGDLFERATNSSNDEGKEIDCDDGNPDVYPGAPELGPGIDYNCDGFVDGPRIYRMSGCDTAPASPGWWLLSRRRGW